ncbi:MAG: TIGR02680 family protein [Actinobacteria bacterium]|nr:TIGR02680 family protein [Actinomycetota bacterium]
MTERWKLSRAGIINVFQYGDETLRFGDGRLLLRGVNGSGKSTAMNMLLPFLLDADVRRIDAAGEQSGVLKSWMLSGRTEPQPTGYLWLEMKRGADSARDSDGDVDAAEYIVFGCGIRANRNSDTVNHWWFITDRRVGIDLDLVRATGAGPGSTSPRAPLSADQLRAEIGAESVWTKDQRIGYRNTLAQRLFGGASIESHIKLLHIVRNPRVGDRVEVDLPQHLHDALPQLSAEAIDDAATPLEKLEEHRHNVGQLEATSRALNGLLDVYRAYASSELRRLGSDAESTAQTHRRREADASSAKAAALDAQATVEDIDRDIDEFTGTVSQHQGELDALRLSPAFQSITQLADKRERLGELHRDLTNAEERHASASSRLTTATADVEQAASETAACDGRVIDSIEALAAVATAASLRTTLPARLDVATTQRHSRGASSPIVAPTGPLDTSHARSLITGVRATAQQRIDETAEAIEGHAATQRAAGVLVDAERRLGDAVERFDHAVSAETEASELVHVRSDELGAALARWDERCANEIAVVLAGDHGVEAAGDLTVSHEHELQRRRSRLEAHRQDASHQAGLLAAQLASHEEAQRVAEERVAELAGREFPDPPMATWQRDRTRPSLAEVLEFNESVDDNTRRGIESALEASGLLSAEVSADGLVSSDGQLLLAPPSARSRVGRGRTLGDLVTVSLPSGTSNTMGTAVQAVIDAISIDPADLADPDSNAGADAVATADGSFRLGPLVGRHTKTMAEHIGVSARRAALERLRREAADDLTAAQQAVATTERDIATVEARLATIDRLATELPSNSAMIEALTRRSAAEEARELADIARSNASEARDEADLAHARSVEMFHRRCAELALPRERDQLDAIRSACSNVAPRADALSQSIDALAGSVVTWLSRADRWNDAASALTEADDARRSAERRHDAAALELATLEDQLGASEAEILGAIETAEGSLREAQASLNAARDRDGPAKVALGVAQTEAATAQQLRSESEERCAREVDRILQAVAVPGLWEAANSARPNSTPTDAAPLPSAERTPTGLRTLATTLLSVAAMADSTAVGTEESTADSVRNSLRARRPELGAGWDAQDRQRDSDLPLEVVVVGPLGTMTLPNAAAAATGDLANARGLLTAQQGTAISNLLQGLIADEVATKMHAAEELVARMNRRLAEVRTSHGVGVSLRWKGRDDLDDETATMVSLLGSRRDLRRDVDQEQLLIESLSRRIDEARRAEPEATYATLIASLFDYRQWHRLHILVHRAGGEPERLKKGTALSEGEKKMVSYQPLFAAVAASCDALAESAAWAPRFVLLDDAFAKVSEDNHAKLFGLLVDLDLDFIATSERLSGTHSTVPELAITEVIRDADQGVIVLEHAHWDGHRRVDLDEAS